MKTRTAAFDRAWAERRTRYSLFYVELRRRYWNGSAFVRETDPITFYPKDIDKIGAITRRFDESKTGLRFSNVTISFKSGGWKWLTSNITTGIFRPDSVSTLGYEPVDSEIIIYYGYKLHTDTVAAPATESLAMFTGFIEDDPVLDTKSGIASVTVIGKAEAMLKGKTATAVHTTLTNHATDPTVGDNSNRSFSGDLKSVFEMSNIRSNAVVKTQGDGADYTLANLNDAEAEASIEFNSTFTPGMGHVILYDGKQWHRDKSPRTLLGLLCDAAGITAGNRAIEDPIFPEVDQSEDVVLTGGSGTQFEATSISGTLRRRWFKIDDFTDNDYTASPAWTIRYNESADTVSAATGALVVTVDGNPSDLHIDTPVDLRDAYGTWEFSLRANGNAGDTGSASRVNFIQYGSGTGGVGYFLNVAPGSQRITLVRRTASADEPMIDLGAWDSSAHTYRITRTAAGLFTVYQDGVQLGATYTDTTYTQTNYFGLRATYSQNGGTPMVTTLDAIYWSNAIVDIAVAVSDADMDFESDEIDLLSAPNSFLPLTVEEVLNGGSRTIKTKTATISGGPYDAEVAVDATLTPQSALKQYIKVVIEASRLAGAFSAPEFSRVTLNWRDADLFIQSADFTGMNCLQAAQAIAERCGMEHGSEDDGTYFARNRTVSGEADLVLNERNALIDITGFTTGKKEIKNIIIVKYGKSGTAGYYSAQHDAAAAGEASPTTAQAIGDKLLEITAEKFLFSNNANVAAAIAEKFYTELYRPKRRCRARCRIIPHLEVSDKVLLSGNDSPLIAKVIFGDPLQDFPAFGPTNTLAREILMKVVGKTDDIIKAETLLDLEEILA